jgi:CheY-like chemotaxis protein
MSEGIDHLEKQTILVVDDSEENIAIVVSILKALYRVKIATSGEQALHIAFSIDPPDLILSDGRYPSYLCDGDV